MNGEWVNGEWVNKRCKRGKEEMDEGERWTSGCKEENEWMNDVKEEMKDGERRMIKNGKRIRSKKEEED